MPAPSLAQSQASDRNRPDAPVFAASGRALPGLAPFLPAPSKTVGGAFGVQIRGPGCNLQFGGMNDKETEWKTYEIEWLRSLAVPLYLARLNANCTRVDFYSLWPVWLVLGGSQSPFRIVCEFDDPSSSAFTLPEATKEAGHAYGDGATSFTSLGPPFLSVTQEQLSEPTFIDRAAFLMGHWKRKRFQEPFAASDCMILESPR